MKPFAERLTVVLVEPQYAGNVGGVARALMNFGVTRLALVNPQPMTDEGRDRAVHAQKVLDDALVFDDWRTCFDHFDHLAAFSARVSLGDRSHTRNPVPLLDAVPTLHAVDGEVALVFGREDDGLPNDVVEACDQVLQIPTHPMYTSMNLSHAVTVALYEMTRTSIEVRRMEPASHHEKEVMFHHYAALVSTIGMPPHRQELTLTAFRRVVGRAGLSRWEFHRLMGIVSLTLKNLKAWPVPGVPAPPADDPDAPAPDEG